MEQTYEVEVKVLLGDRAHADALLDALKRSSPSVSLHLLGTHRQLNHYFTGDDAAACRLPDAMRTVLAERDAAAVADVIAQGKNFSVRTRDADGKIFLVIKASVDETTSANGTARREVEALTACAAIDDCDALLLNSGFTIQAKWSRERTTYQYGDMTICLDRNAGYGYLAEFELIVHDPSRVDTAKDRIRALLQDLEQEELTQDRLERMFTYYNTHWREYYGTEKTFTIY